MKKYLFLRILIPFTSLVCIAIFFIFFGAIFFSSQGERFSRKGDYRKALRYYQICVERYPNYSGIPEVLLRMAEIYHLKFDNYVEAKKIYQKVIKNYPDTQWEKLARGKIKDCYNYFPLQEGNFWLEGDSESGGKNYSAEISCIEPYRVIKKVYAGKKLVATINLTYKKTEKELYEYDSTAPDWRLVLRYPLKIGDTWSIGKNLEKVVYTVISKEEEVKTKSGQFTDCLKIRQEKKATPGSLRYDYYAPGIGRVLITQASQYGSKEVRISELLSYKIVEE